MESTLYSDIVVTFFVAAARNGSLRDYIRTLAAPLGAFPTDAQILPLREELNQPAPCCINPMTIVTLFETLVNDLRKAGRKRSQFVIIAHTTDLIRNAVYITFRHAGNM